MLSRVLCGFNHASCCGDTGGFRCHGDQGRFCHGSAETQTEGKSNQPGQAAFACEGRGHGLAYGEQALVQAMDKKGQAQHHENDPQQQLAQVGERLLQNHKLEEYDHQKNGYQVSQATKHGLEKFYQGVGHSDLFNAKSQS